MVRHDRSIPASDRAPRPWHLRARAVLGLAAVAVVTTSCSWRLETPEPEWPTPSAVTLERDAAAEREQRVLDALAGAGTGGTGRGALAAIEADAAHAHLDALGGVYVAYPDSAEEPAEQAADSLNDAVRAARDGAFATAWATADADLAALMSSVGLTHAFALWHGAIYDARAAGADVVLAAERTLPANGPLAGQGLVPDGSVGEPTAIETDVLAQLAVEHDQARYLYEVIAARSGGTDRANARVRMAIHDARAEALVALDGVEDRRDHVYSVLAVDVTGSEAQAASARATEQALGWRYASLVVDAADADRAWLLNAAFDAYAASAVLPGFTPDEFPVLPGLSTTAASD